MTLKAGRLILTTGILAIACSGNPADRLHALFDEAWEFQLREDPLFATTAGAHQFNHLLPSVSSEDHQRRADFRRDLLNRLGSIQRDRLSRDDEIHYDIFKRELEQDLAEHEFRTYEMPITVDSGFHIGFAMLPTRVPLASAGDYENYIARLRAFPAYAQQHIESMRRGLERGFSLPRIVLQGYEVTIASHVVDDPEKSVFHAPFASFPSTIAEKDRDRLRTEGRSAIMESVVPGYRAFLEFMTAEYIPGARNTIGASEMPRGREYYNHLVGYFTTLDISYERVHQIGLEEVKRIRSEMQDVIGKTGFKGSFAEFLRFLRTDRRFYPTSAEHLLKEASYIAKRMDGKLPSLFKTLPRQPYGIQPVPDHLAPKYTAGRYVGAPVESRRAGNYWVNIYALESRPLYALEALTLHEAVPGHHLQNALRQELQDLPNFRRFTGYSAFGEGWGLYSERLGLEAGFYADPYSNFGRLTYEMWRACRLVVDTGIHAMGWTREQAMDFLASNTALSLHEVRTETDRYISWPGQALAYKMGELKIRELRSRAEQALGEAFDLREFHDAVLLSGSIPLNVLEAQVERYIDSKRQ